MPKFRKDLNLRVLNFVSFFQSQKKAKLKTCKLSTNNVPLSGHILMVHVIKLTRNVESYAKTLLFTADTSSLFSSLLFSPPPLFPPATQVMRVFQAFW